MAAQTTDPCFDGFNFAEAAAAAALGGVGVRDRLPLTFTPKVDAPLPSGLAVEAGAQALSQYGVNSAAGAVVD